jgi:deoxyhypusine synthase
MKSGIEYMTFLADWYPKNSRSWIFSNRRWYRRFPNLCGSNVTKIWKCQKHLFGAISAKFQIQLPVTVHSGAVPNEKITWGKLDMVV